MRGVFAFCGTAILAMAVQAGEIGSVNDVMGRILERELSQEFVDIIPRAGGLTNFQTFSGSLGGIVADPITASSNDDQPFTVKGENFLKLSDAINRSCSNQMNTCADAANKAGGGGGGGGGKSNTAAAGANSALTVSACNTQNTNCVAFASGGLASGVLKSQDSTNYIFCSD